MQVYSNPERERDPYVDKKDGRSAHVGYVIGQHWCTAYVPYEGGS